MTTINCKFATFKNGASRYLCALYSETKYNETTLFPINERIYDEIKRSGLFEDVPKKPRHFRVSTLDKAYIEQDMLCVECEEMQTDGWENANSDMTIEVTYEKIVYKMKCETDLQNIADLLQGYAGCGRFNFDSSIYGHKTNIVTNNRESCNNNDSDDNDSDGDTESKLRICESPKKITKHVAPPNIKIAHRLAKQVTTKNSRGTKRKLETSDDDDNEDCAFSKKN